MNTCRGELVDRLILPHQSRVHPVLSKIEDPQYIHTYLRTAEGTQSLQGVIFELPRLGLEFMLRGEGVISHLLLKMTQRSFVCLAVLEVVLLL